ncbi:MAG: hypothetical protein M3Y71_14260 [Actinomycetota bacterium]|nr:hypothetical protein [Actinomycetota bacterium]
MPAPDPALAYQGQVAALATKHGKEEQIAPALRRVGLQVVIANIDTDTFGTFTGDIPRLGTPLEVATRKARAAIEALQTRLGLASEGSFGPHPEVPLLTADLETIVLLDDLHGTVVTEQVISLAATALSRRVAPGEDTSKLCVTVGFPDQALICRPADGSLRHITKGITTFDGLDHAIRRAAASSADNRARVETDLRADRCPARREVIGRVADKLAARLACRCPRCGVPGYGATHHEPGLLCGLCGDPTRLPAAAVLTCSQCDHQERRPALGTADPASCDRCNP